MSLTVEGAWILTSAGDCSWPQIRGWCQKGWTPPQKC